MTNDPPRPVPALLLLLIGGLGLAFGQGHWPNGAAIIVGVICVQRGFRIARPVIAAPIFIGLHVLVWEWAYAGMVPLPSAARLGMEAGVSTLLALVFVLDRAIARRRPGLASTLVLPCGWVAFDLVSARLSPGGTWGSIAYSFVDVDVIAQIASVVGWTGVTFLAVWLASVIGWIGAHLDMPRERRRGVIAAAIVSALVFGLGVWRLHPVSAGPTVRVACVVPPAIFTDEALDALWAYTRGVERPAASIALAQTRIRTSMDEHFSLVEAAADAGAQLIVWPEANPAITDAEEPLWIDRARTTAQTRGVFIGMGMSVFRPSSGQPALNKFVLVDPTGAIVINFLKATRTPGAGHVAGDGRLPVIDTSIGRLTSAICFDLDFPHLIGQAGAAETDLLLAPSNDWTEARATHARMARLRAIEQGVALVRPTKDGVSIVADALGRVRGSLMLDDNETGAMVTEVPVRRRATVYATIGDGFAWLCVSGLAILGVWARAAPRAAAGPR